MKFDGCKVALFLGSDLLVYQRDDKPGLAWAGAWDFPGGGREGRETPIQTLARELVEEFGLPLADAEILWQIQSPALHNPKAHVHFFVARMPAVAEERIRFGDEGQRWALRSIEHVLAMDNIVPSLPRRLRLFFEKSGLGPHMPLREGRLNKRPALRVRDQDGQDKVLEQWRFDLIRTHIRDLALGAGNAGLQEDLIAQHIAARLPDIQMPHCQGILDWLPAVLDDLERIGELIELDGVIPRRVVLSQRAD